MFRKIYSWILGIRIGDRRYIKASPLFVGESKHFLPMDIWDDALKSSYLLRTHKQILDGYQWFYSETYLTSTSKILGKQGEELAIAIDNYGVLEE